MLRMCSMRLLYLILVVLVLHSTCFGQGRVDGFYKKKHEASVVLGGGFEDSKKYLAGDTKLDLERNVYYASVFTAFGITDALDVNLSIPYITSNDESDFQDISVFLKYRFLQHKSSLGNFELGTAAGFSTPLSDYKIGGLNDIGQQATVIDTRAMLHFSTNSFWFATLQSGFSFKLEEVPNSFPATLKIGRATSKLYYDVFYDFQKSIGGIDYRGTPAPQNFRELGVDFHKIGGTLYKPFSSSLGAYVSVSYTFDGRNTFLGAAYGLGMSCQINSN
jgi:Putative MetA-pathway of phenol degradation